MEQWILVHVREGWVEINEILTLPHVRSISRVLRGKFQGENTIQAIILET